MSVKKPIAIAAAMLAGGLVLAACGGSDSADSATSAPATSAPASSPMATAEDTMMAQPDIVTIASETEGFSTLVAALQAAGLVETLQGDGPFTVFAPTDDAFAALPKGVLDALLLPENKDTLAAILTYHVVPGAVMAADVTDGKVATVEGSDVTLSTKDGVTVNGAKVIQADIEGSNGVIHVIDEVILPPNVDVNALLKK